MALQGYERHVITKTNFNYKWYDTSFWAEYIQKEITSARLASISELPDTLPLEWKLKTVLRMSESEWRELIQEFKNCDLTVSPLLPESKFQEILNPIQQAVDTTIKSNSIVADITGLTKLHTLALYNLAKAYDFDRVYLPEKKLNSVIILP